MLSFFVGLHQPNHAKQFERCMVSVNRLEKRQSDFEAGRWIMDSGAFSRITSGKGHLSVQEYADLIRRWRRCGTLEAAVTQDYMCEPFVLAKTGLTVADHQRMTIERYDALLAEDTGVYIMPVLQGYRPEEYAEHVRMYGDRLAFGAWVGVGSVCKRNADPGAIIRVLDAIRAGRPDLRLHGFGMKLTALASGLVQAMLYSADSMAWSYAARKQGRDGNSVWEAQRFTKRVVEMPVQGVLALKVVD